MTDYLTWGTLIAAGASLLAWVKFWIDVGSDRQRISNAEREATAAAAKAELIAADLAKFKIEAAREFASSADLAEAERRFASAIEGLALRFDRMAERLDRVLEQISQKNAK
jgi:hypothetical protein